MWDLTSVGEGNEAFLIRVWKLLPSRRVLKPRGEALEGKAQRGQYLLAVGLDKQTSTKSYVSSLISNEHDKHDRFFQVKSQTKLYFDYDQVAKNY